MTRVYFVAFFRTNEVSSGNVTPLEDTILGKVLDNWWIVTVILLLGGCGEKEAVSVSPNFKYETQGDAITITGFDRWVKGALTIPATIEGKTVTSIGSEAFSWCQQLTSIAIPDSVNSIGKGAFSWCSSLRSITIPDSVTSIGKHAFAGCESLTNITISDGVTDIGDSAFYAYESLTSVTIGESVTSIGENPFMGCQNLTAVTFLGDAPKLDNSVFVIENPTIYRKPEAKGWDDTFGGRPVKLISEKP